MDRQQEIQESFNHYFQSFFPDEGQSLAFLSRKESSRDSTRRRRVSYYQSILSDTCRKK